MEIFFKVIDIINYVCIGITTLGFIFQLIYIIFIWMKPKHFKETKEFSKIAVVICGRNEEEVIYETINKLKTEQDYPLDKFDVFVCAHNCTDNTAEEARKAGAIVYEYNDDDPAHARVAYPFKFILEKIQEEYDNYDFIIRFDADNHCCKSYLKEMNNAYHDGVKIARPFEWAKNAYQNLWTKVSAAYYIRDSRIPSNFRERAGLSSMLTGAGMMVSMEVVKKYGWDAMGLSEDAEYTLNRVMDNERVHYVADAIVFEDQPSSLKDTFSRNKRMGNGLFHLFFKKGFRYLGHFFKTGNFSFIDLFMQLFFIPVGVLCIIWFPLYYIFIILSHTVNAFGPNWMTWMTPNESSLFLWNLGIMVGYILAGFVLVFAIQTWLALIQSKKHLGLKNLKGLWGGVWLGFVFMIIYDIAITAGVFSKPKWVQIKRNKEN